MPAKLNMLGQFCQTFWHALMPHGAVRHHSRIRSNQSEQDAHLALHILHKKFYSVNKILTPVASCQDGSAETHTSL